MAKQLILLCGYPASGKSTYATTVSNAIVVSRDDIRGTYASMLKTLDKYKNEPKLVIDNTLMTSNSRAQFIAWGNKNDFEIQIICMMSSIEDCQIRHLIRMFNKHTKIYYQGEGPPSHIMYGPVVLFHARKQFEPPTNDDKTNTEYIKTEHPYAKTKYQGIGIFFDLDGTLQNYETKEPYTDISIMKQKLKQFINTPFIIVTNQSGIHKGDITEDQIHKQINNLERLLDVKFIRHICPHKAAPISCFCRKPQVGFAVEEVERLQLNPKKCMMIGDKTTDKTFANRMGMIFMNPDKFWEQ